jgi:O-antigen ligase
MLVEPCISAKREAGHTRRNRAGAVLLASWSKLEAGLAAGVLIPTSAVLAKGQRWLLAILLLDIPLKTGAHFMNHEDLVSHGGVSGLEISLTTGAIVALYALWFAHWVVDREVQKNFSLRTSLPLGLFLLFECVSTVVARTPTFSAFEIFLTAEMFFLYVYLANWIKTRDDVLFVVRFLLAGLLMESIIIIALQLTGFDFKLPGFHAYPGSASEEGFTRVGGTLVSPNYAAGYLSMVLAPTLGVLLLARLRLRYMALAAVTIVLGVLALMPTYSRGGFLALLGAAAFLLIAAWGRIPRIPKAFVFVSVLVVIIALSTNTVMSARVFGNDEGSAYSRVTLNALAWNMIKDHPILGVGANNFTVVMNEYATGRLAGEWLYAVHNKYLLIWAESGIGAIIAYLWFVGASIRRGWKVWKSQRRFYSPLALGLVAGICAMLINLMFEPDRGRTTLQLLIVMATMLLAIDSWPLPQAFAESESGMRRRVLSQEQ